MSEMVDAFRYKASEETVQKLRALAPKYSRLNRDFSLTKQDCIEGKNLSDNINNAESNLELKTYDGFKVYVLGEKNSDEAILYLHGGGYLFGLYKNQVGIMDKFYQETGKQVYIVDYGLPVKYNWEHAYTLLEKVYEEIISNNKNFILIGDSAGAGMGLGFIQLLNQRGQKTPRKQVLISPWLDITMSNPEVKNYEEKDAFLAVDCLIGAGELWANGLDRKDPRLSPIFGDLTNIPETMLTTGTCEVMYPDIIKLSEELTNNGTKVHLIICEGLYHAYPYFPIEDSKLTLQKIIDFIR